MTRTVNIRDAKAHLSRLVRQVAKGESFIITNAGKPLARIVPIDQPETQTRRVGFMTGLLIPEDFDRMGSHEIEQRFDADI
ncbi:type II toxin-antitoxin system Phd/YefM family antitoxin [Mesorhizobium erdmanii]|uniref:Antitoxin n=1 Tax=Mesorhizobium erdmanii TaxID=1777866 RepID=A0A6M7UDX2_9HYPH|nr:MULTISPECIES: type II toxin-antitoxin system prevent-host-death family antitoxin [Mesorhizobium]OBQ70171.1 prevent-host-death protein [Mesorhizobium loti]QKC76049.1 type II toxin-antitoxin system prevent-host-death family antitoxin [Mesorhizobium erdmanii]